MAFQNHLCNYDTQSLNHRAITTRQSKKRILQTTHHNRSKTLCSVLKVPCPASESQAQYSRTSKMSGQFLQMKVMHVASGTVRENNCTAIPRRITREVKQAVQFTIFNWNFYRNLNDQSIRLIKSLNLVK